MGSELLAATVAPPAEPPLIPSTTTTTTTTGNGTTTTTITTITTTTCSSSAADGITTTTTTATTTTTTTTITTTSNATTISSLCDDDLREIFLRLPNLPALIRAAFTCRSWLGAIRSSSSFRRLFRALHPAPLVGLFLKIDDATAPSFVPLRRSDPDVTAALRRGDFFLTSLPFKADTFSGWSITDCRDGYILLWNMLEKPSIAAVNPMTWAVDIIPLPDDVEAGSGLNFGFLGFHLLSSDDNPLSFRVVCVCKDQQRVRAAVFLPETSAWAVHPWVEIGGDNSHSLKYGAGTLVDGSIYWPFHGEERMIRINTATMDVSSVDLPSPVQVNGPNFRAGETKDGKLCIVYASDDFLLHVWVRGADGDGIEIWVLQNMPSLSAEIDRITPSLRSDLELVQIRSGYIPGSQGDLEILQVGSGYVYFSMTHITPAGTLRCWFSLSLETMEIELLIHGGFGGRGYPYVMAWPPCLVGDGGGTGHEVAGSH